MSYLSGHVSIAVLDLTHAGIIIAKKFAELGFNVTAVDVYRTVEESILSGLTNEHGIVCYREPVDVDVDGFDLVVSPVHLDPGYPVLADAVKKGIDIITHHMATGIILSMEDFSVSSTVIEVTGSKAKTSSASLMAEMLSQKMKVILHTSKGLEIWESGHSRTLYQGLSIAPGSMLLAVDKLKEMGIDADCYIFEVSIGLTGFADVGVITTLEPDYLIAASSSNASDSKVSVLSYARAEEVFFLNAGDPKALGMAEKNKRTFFTFADSEYTDTDVTYTDVVADVKAEVLEGTLVLRYSESILSPVLDPDYDAGSYATAFAASSAVAIQMGVPLDDISRVLASFRGLQGRMQEKELSGRRLIDNSNSGMDIRSAERSLDHALKKLDQDPSGVIMVLGEEAEQVCEGLSPEDVSGFVKRRGKDISRIILVGARMKGRGSENTLYAPGLDEGLKKASDISSENDIILSCVKCFR